MRRYQVHFGHDTKVWKFDNRENAYKRAYYQSGKHPHDITLITDLRSGSVLLRIVGISYIRS
jgi:cystathionine beta-lyase family protein involved in aluminum resistance